MDKLVKKNMSPVKKVKKPKKPKLSASQSTWDRYVEKYNAWVEYQNWKNKVSGL